MNNGYRRLDIEKLKNRKHTIASTKKSLQEITPIDWSADVCEGRKKVQMDKRGISLVCVK